MKGWIRHDRRRIWWAPWRSRCACGVDAYPCPALRWRRAQAEVGLAAAREWRDVERSSWRY